MPKSKPSLYSVVTVLTLFAMLVLAGCREGESEQAKLDREQALQKVRAENQELKQLQAENQELPRLRKDNEELKRLLAQTATLPRLREENQRLRSELDALKPAKSRPPAPK